MTNKEVTNSRYNYMGEHMTRLTVMSIRLYCYVFLEIFDGYNLYANDAY